MICLVIGCWEGEVHLWDKAEALQWYVHRSKLHSANKEKTNNERKKNPLIRSLVSSGWPDPRGFFKKVTPLPLRYVDCALLIRKQDKDNPSLNLFDLMMCRSVTHCSFCICICGKLTQQSNQVLTTALFLLTRPVWDSRLYTWCLSCYLYLYGNTKPSRVITFITVSLYIHMHSLATLSGTPVQSKVKWIIIFLQGYNFAVFVETVRNLLIILYVHELYWSALYKEELLMCWLPYLHKRGGQNIRNSVWPVSVYIASSEYKNDRYSSHFQSSSIITGGSNTCQ